MTGWIPLHGSQSHLRQDSVEGLGAIDHWSAAESGVINIIPPKRLAGVGMDVARRKTVASQPSFDVGLGLLYAAALAHPLDLTGVTVGVEAAAGVDHDAVAGVDELLNEGYGSGEGIRNSSDLKGFGVRLGQGAVEVDADRGLNHHASQRKASQPPSLRTGS
jgi:hypothetical protein